MHSKITKCSYITLVPVSTPVQSFAGFVFIFCHLTGPRTPASVNVSVVMNGSVAGLLVSWEPDQEVYGPIEYNVMSDLNLMCKTTSSSCTLSVVGCGEVHTIQVTASNEAGPSYPSSPAVFITCEQKRYECVIHIMFFKNTGITFRV